MMFWIIWFSALFILLFLENKEINRNRDDDTRHYKNKNVHDWNSNDWRNFDNRYNK